VYLHYFVHIDARELDRNQHLDHQLVARRRREVRWGAQPLSQLGRTFLGDVEALLWSLVNGGVIRLDEAVALEPLKGRIHLSDVQRPHLTGPGLEFLTQLQSILGPFAE
jgi:hypothetical protein